MGLSGPRALQKNKKVRRGQNHRQNLPVDNLEPSTNTHAYIHVIIITHTYIYMHIQLYIYHYIYVYPCKDIVSRKMKGHITSTSEFSQGVQHHLWVQEAPDLDRAAQVASFNGG